MDRVVTPSGIGAEAAWKAVSVEAARPAGSPTWQQHTWSGASPCSWQSGAGLEADAEQAVLAEQMLAKLRLPAARKIVAISKIERFTGES